MTESNHARVAEGSWRLGVPFSRTGVTASAETPQFQATLLAIEDVNAAGGMLGRPIESTAYDPASTPNSSAPTPSGC